MAVAAWLTGLSMADIGFPVGYPAQRHVVIGQLFGRKAYAKKPCEMAFVYLDLLWPVATGAILSLE
ncbi:hypothetical protein ALON55S_01488 [Alishewanella longhuensis]